MPINTAHLLRQARSVIKGEGLPTMVAKSFRTAGMLVLGDDWYNRPLARAIRKAAHGRPLFVDVGAHHGSITRQTAAAFEKVLAVEPDPKNVDLLRQAIGSARNVEVVAKALGSEPGQMPLYGDPDNDGDQSLVPRAHYRKVADVDVTTLDLLLAEEPVNHGVVIKLDVQGFEPSVLAGGESTLRADCLIISEFWPWGLREAGNDAGEFLSQMNKVGYEVQTLKGRPFEKSRLARFIDLGRGDPYLVTEVVFVRGAV